MGLAAKLYFDAMSKIGESAAVSPVSRELGKFLNCDLSVVFFFIFAFLSFPLTPLPLLLLESNNGSSHPGTHEMKKEQVVQGCVQPDSREC